ncbi:uncharacterized protein [Dermacentor andersoni]|uniref:uncharacterized protein n=1 Tax=Dermacentor andersoni TaxID=34620 RepID=UPI002416FE17|nr:uncharacterized protein LOC129387160 [Dermacentor andersoni]
MHLHVCSFKGKPACLMDDGNPDWAPSLRLGHGRYDRTTVVSSARYMRCKRRQQNKPRAVCKQPVRPVTPPEHAIGSELEPDELTPMGPILESTTTTEAEVQTELTCRDLQLLEEDYRKLSVELATLKQQKEEMEMSEASLREDPNKVSFYTGLPNFVVLMAVFNLLEKFVKHTPQNSLVKFQEFLVFLMKLKLNLPYQDLAYRFNISESTVCRIFDKWLHVAFCRLKPLMSWPSRQAIRRTMPQAFFESFGEKVAVIVDCFEIKLERPSSLQPRCQTWSQYKSSNTAKYLIGICPQGVITFISDGWGGRTPDKHITEHCGILDHLSHGDVVLADRGFDIADSVGLYCAKLHIPAFTKGKRQLSAVDVEATRNIANVRIHVERVIGLVRNKYVIMKSVLPLEYATLKQGHQFAPLDKIVNVCCALRNFCQSVVPANPEPCS